jgi:hypothetical protein
MQHHGKKISMHAVCKFNGYTVTTDGELSGDFNFAYSGKLTTSITKPADEVTLEETTIESKWLGSCPAGRKAGTVVVTLPGTSESIEMDMNNPEVKAALEAMKAGIIRDQK